LIHLGIIILSKDITEYLAGAIGTPRIAYDGACTMRQWAS
jgi:hypothetical protein